MLAENLSLHSLSSITHFPPPPLVEWKSFELTVLTMVVTRVNAMIKSGQHVADIGSIFPGAHGNISKTLVSLRPLSLVKEKTQWIKKTQSKTYCECY